MKSNYKLGEDQSCIMKSILHPYDLRTTNMIKCTILLWLACFIFWSMLAWELFGIPIELPWLALFWVLLAFLDQPFWLLQLSISNIPRITTSMLAFQVPHLVYLHIGGKAPTLGRSDHSLEITWLIDPSDGLNLMSNLDSFFKSFSFYQMIFNSH